MTNLGWTLCARMKELSNALRDECGQDMIEYALVIGLIIFGAVAASQSMATAIGTGLTGVGSKLTAYTS